MCVCNCMRSDWLHIVAYILTTRERERERETCTVNAVLSGRILLLVEACGIVRALASNTFTT